MAVATYEPGVLVSTEGLPEEEWLEWRRKGIGGSDASIVLGVSPFATARDLYFDKLKIVSYKDDSGNWVALKIGHLLEDLVAEIFHKKTGYPIYQIKKMFYHPLYPYMLADVDYFATLPNGDTAILEIKTTNYNAKDNWWIDGDETVPVNYEAQGRHYMAVMNLNHVFYCCLYGNNEDDVIIRHIEQDKQSFADKLREKAAVIGTCPRCGGTVSECKIGYACETKDCNFVLWKDNKFMKSIGLSFTKTVATALVGKGFYTAKNLVSAKTGNKYSAKILLVENGGKYPGYDMEFINDKKKGIER